jgi:phosphoglycerate dehydrogenase-like enzyme
MTRSPDWFRPRRSDIGNAQQEGASYSGGRQEESMTNKQGSQKTNADDGVVADGASPAKFRVAITGDFEKLAMTVAPWHTLGGDTEIVAFTEPFASADQTVQALRDFDAVTLMHERISLPREVLERLPRLKLIVGTGRKNQLDEEAAAMRGIVVIKSNPSFDVPSGTDGGRSPSELAIALLLSCTWQPGPATTLIRAGGWAFQPGIPLRGKSLGVVGYGDIGKPVARVGLALGMRVLVFNRSLSEEAARAEHVTRVALDTLLKSSDVISIHLPLNASTRGIIGAQQIAQMKDGVILINTARAHIIDEKPFIEALRTRKIAMAGLDVFWEEPLPKGHPLGQLPNVVMTPHIGYVTYDTMAVRYRVLLETLAEFREGNNIGR